MYYYSFLDECEENYFNCYAEIGGVEWLPASEYLRELATVSVSYFDFGICKDDSLLYNELMCDECKLRRRTVSYWLLLLFVASCILFVLIKLLITWLVPDTPAWVVASKARADFMNQQVSKETGEKERKRNVEQLTIDDEADLTLLEQEMKQINEEQHLTQEDEERAKATMKRDFLAKNPPKKKEPHSKSTTKRFSSSKKAGSPRSPARSKMRQASPKQPSPILASATGFLTRNTKG